MTKRVGSRRIVLIALFTVGVCAGRTFVSADSLTTVATTALEGNQAIKVIHDNTDVSWVQDDRSDAEITLAISFLLRVESLSHSGAFRQPILSVHGPNPGPIYPGSACADPAVQPWIRNAECFHQVSAGGASRVKCWVKGRLCGDRTTPLVDVPVGQTKRVCVEWKAGTAQVSRMALAVVAPTQDCPPSGSPEYVEPTSGGWNSNGLNTEFIRLGTPGTNLFNANDLVEYRFDDYRLREVVFP